MTAALRLRVAMAAENVDVMTLSRMAYISRDAVKRMLDGERKTKWITMTRLAVALDVPVEWLADGRNPPQWLLDMVEAPVPAKVW